MAASIAAIVSIQRQRREQEERDRKVRRNLGKKTEADNKNNSVKTIPKFRVGQVVMMKTQKRHLPFTILGMLWETNEWYYQWNKKNYAAEHMLRELTADER